MDASQLNNNTPRGIIIAANSTGSGKTLVTSAIINLLKQNYEIVAGKAGPDYIDPYYHKTTTKQNCLNYDAWAMTEIELKSQLQSQLQTPPQSRSQNNKTNLVVIEGVMGLFDDAKYQGINGAASTAKLSEILNCPIILVVNGERLSHGIAALVHGHLVLQPKLNFIGVIVNKISSPKHQSIVEDAFRKYNLPLLGCIAKNNELILPARHLGLIQAEEINNLPKIISKCSQELSKMQLAKKIDSYFKQPVGKIKNENKKIKKQNLNLNIKQNAKQNAEIQNNLPKGIPKLGHKTAIAYDKAFRFIYPHVIKSWLQQGCQLSYFSPLNHTQLPPDDCDSIYFPGGYPELFVEQLSNNKQLRSFLKLKKQQNCTIYGECGGYMIMGQQIQDKQAKWHRGLELLPHLTSFAKPKLHLGYELIKTDVAAFANNYLLAHSFHYAEVVKPLGNSQPDKNQNAGVFNCLLAKRKIGHKDNNCFGSFLHVINCHNGKNSEKNSEKIIKQIMPKTNLNHLLK